MIKVLVRHKMLENPEIYKGTPPGRFDYDFVVETDTDCYEPSGRILFKFRKRSLPKHFNDACKRLVDVCVVNESRRADASGELTYESSRTLGYNIDQRIHSYVVETSFTKDFYSQYRNLISLIEYVNRIYKIEFPRIYSAQEKLIDTHHKAPDDSQLIDPRYLIGNSVFSQAIINQTLRTRLHRDKGNIANTVSNMVCLGDFSFSGGMVVLPEYRVAINMRPRDYLGFMGQEVWHGNSEIFGQGNRITVVCYIKKNILGKKYYEEVKKIKDE